MSGPREDEVRNPRDLQQDGVTRDLEEAERIHMDQAARSDGYLDRPKDGKDDDD
jgi:hypothetical protein